MHLDPLFDLKHKTCRDSHRCAVIRIPVWISLMVVSCATAVPQAVNNTPSPRDQDYVLFGRKAKKDSEQVRALRGTVVDTAGHPVSGATVRLKDVASNSIRTVTSDNAGSFRFDELSLTQDYNVEATFKGAGSPRRTISQFDSRKTVTVELRLEKSKESAKP